jgi:hypothetical protein
LSGSISRRAILAALALSLAGIGGVMLPVGEALAKSGGGGSSGSGGGGNSGSGGGGDSGSGGGGDSGSGGGGDSGSGGGGDSGSGGGGDEGGGDDDGNDRVGGGSGNGKWRSTRSTKGADDEDDNDYKRARKARKNGNAKPLGEVIALVKSRYPGEVVSVRLSKGQRLVYRVKLVSSGGRLLRITVDASTARIIGVDGI